MDANDRIQIIFDGPPSHESGRFVEVEAGGKSINFGEWKQVKDGYWILELPLCLADLAILTAAQPLGDKAVPVLEKWPALCSLLTERIKEIDGDERYHYPPALVQVNAPLALIQVSMTAKMAILKEIRALLEALPDKVTK